MEDFDDLLDEAELKFCPPVSLNTTFPIRKQNIDSKPAQSTLLL